MINTEFHKGIHIIADLWDCTPEKLFFVSEVKKTMNKAVSESKLTSLKDYFFQFNPVGVTGVCVLSQSHFSIHTWPEKNFASIDIFTCGPPEQALKAFETLCNELKPKRIEKKFLERMDEQNSINSFEPEIPLIIEKK